MEDSTNRGATLPLSYVLPLAARTPQTRALTGYLRRLGRIVDDVIVVDGSPDDVFAAQEAAWSAHIRHIRPELRMANGKVAGVMTGVWAARHEHIVLGDDDVRYRRSELSRMLSLLRCFDVVRPQNYFHPMPWHARWDTARSLLNRLGDGDWPGTLGIRRSTLLHAGGYSGEVLFENLELVRTIRATGGVEAAPADFFVARRPPDPSHFRSQRLRQAYDEWARPARFAAQLALLPVGLLLARRSPRALIAAAVCGALAAEAGRRKGGGRAVFPATSALWAPGWLAERAFTSWMALGTRLFRGGVRYREGRLAKAATSPRVLERNLRNRERPPVADAQDQGMSIR